MTCLFWSKKQAHVLSWFLGYYVSDGLPGGSDGQESACSTGDLGWEDTLEEEIGYPLQYCCLENSMDRGAHKGYSPWDCKESDMTERLKCTHMFLIVNFFFLLGCGDRGRCDECYNLSALTPPNSTPFPWSSQSGYNWRSIYSFDSK